MPRLRAITLILMLTVPAVLATSAHGQQERGPGILICYPNAPGSTRAARPVMGRLGQYLSDRMRRSCEPIYFNEVVAAREWLAAERPRYAILSLALYLRWKEELALQPLSSSVRGGKTTDRFYLLVKKGSRFKRLEDLTQNKQPTRIWSSHLDDPRFATNVVFAGKVVVKEVQRGSLVKPAFKSGTVRVISSSRPVSALRRMKRDKTFKDEPVDAVLVDGTTWDRLQKLRMFRGVLHVLYTSPSLPTPPVVAFPGTASEELQRMSQVLRDMGKDSEGKKLLDTLMITGFSAPVKHALSSASALYARKVGS